jgi:hypothetical protein
MYICTHSHTQTIQDAVVIRGKIWRSLDLANHSNATNSYNSPNIHSTSTTSTPATNVHHNSLINANQTSHYQRHDFKNRRSSSEPGNEQKLHAHLQSNSNSNHNNSNNNNTNTTPPSNNQTNSNQTNSTNNSSLVIDDATVIDNPSDDFIDCLHQKNMKVSKIQKVTKIKIAKLFSKNKSIETKFSKCYFYFIHKKYLKLFLVGLFSYSVCICCILFLD